MSATLIALRLLLEDAGVVALVGSAVYPAASPQGVARPYIVVSTISEEQDVVLGGALAGYFSRVQIACIADAAPTADAIGEAVKDAMSSVLNTAVTDAESPAEEIGTATAFKDGADFLDFNDDRTIFRRLMDYSLRWIPA